MRIPEWRITMDNTGIWGICIGVLLSTHGNCGSDTGTNIKYSYFHYKLESSNTTFILFTLQISYSAYKVINETGQTHLKVEATEQSMYLLNKMQQMMPTK